MNPLDLINLTRLTKLTSGRPEIIIGLIDGPVLVNHPDLASENIHKVPGRINSKCSFVDSTACMHGTFVAGILCAKRSSLGPAICPNCTLLVRPIFPENKSGNGKIPSATPEELAEAILDCIRAGARLINLSAAIGALTSKRERELEEILDYAARRGVVLVAAAGNQAVIGSSAITRHPWVIPVIACDHQGKPMWQTNLGSSIGRRGLSAPGDNIMGLGAQGKPIVSGGTSAAAPFVTGAMALLWSEFPGTTATELRFAVTRSYAKRRTTVVPPLLDAWAAYQFMKLECRK